MESDRAVMSRGGGMVNGSHVANGTGTNGVVDSSSIRSDTASEHRPVGGTPASHINGGAVGVKKPTRAVKGATRVQDFPPEVLELITTDAYLPIARIIHRSAQVCWNDMRSLIIRMSRMPVPPQFASAGIQVNDQSYNNLEKKDLLLKFAQEHRANFIKLMVLLDWSQKSEAVKKTIALNYWLSQQRWAFFNVIGDWARMRILMQSAQVPNPDLYTAAEVLATGKVSELPQFDYELQPTLTSKQTLRILQQLNDVLATRLALEEEVPEALNSYRIHDGRVTFTVTNEFEVDLSLISDKPGSKFLTVDLRFLFSPAPSIQDSQLDEISYINNAAIERDGLAGAFTFLHDLTLSYKLNELLRQVRELLQGLWSGHLRVEMVRRALVVQYWPKKPGAKSWIEIGIDSGRENSNNIVQQGCRPKLKLRWFYNGHSVDNHQITMDTEHLSVENILRQTIAQHISRVFDSIYDTLLLSPLYSDSELEIESVSSLVQPTDCQLTIQLSKTESLQASIEPVRGTLILSPVDERSSRVQADLDRSKSLATDFFPKILGLRCAFAEAALHRKILDTSWELLQGLKISHAELEVLFARPIAKASFFKQPHWPQRWALAVTQTVDGDRWWLMQKQSSTENLGSALTEIIDSKPLHLEGYLTPAYFERLGDYTSGMIMLQSNAQYLSQKKFTYKMPSLPCFSDQCQLPSLRFLHRNSEGMATLIELAYQGIDQASSKTVAVARAHLSADKTVLAAIANSQLDDAISIVPDNGQVVIKVFCRTGSQVVDEVTSKMRHLDNIVACAAAVKRSADHTLVSISLSAITVRYSDTSEPPLELLISFANTSQAVDVIFLPPGKNPHQYLTRPVSKMLLRSSQPLSKSLENVLALLKLTQPMMSYMQDLQASLLGDQAKPKEKATDAFKGSELLRVHILPRAASSFAMQYFAESDAFPRDVVDQETPKKLLVRLEIVPMKRGRILGWLVRPSIEEFETYTRPSFTSEVLRNAIQKAIFARGASDSWRSLDQGAWVPADQPESLLIPLHKCIATWAEHAVKPALKNGSDGLANVNTMAKISAQTAPSRPTGFQKQPQTQQLQTISQQRQSAQQSPQQQRNGLSNGVPRNQQQRPSQNSIAGRPSTQNHGYNTSQHQSNDPKNTNIKKEVITLD